MTNKPKHVAIIMDGNGRWAKSRGLLRVAGHEEGVHRVRDMIASCLRHQIPTLTLFAFGIDNQARPSMEVNFLMQLFLKALQKETTVLVEQHVRLKIVGDYSHFSKKLQQQIASSEEATQAGNKLTLIIAMNYSGHWDITNAAKKLVSDAKLNGLKSDEVTKSLFEKATAFADYSSPDLLIRTSGEKRLSNFMLWQLAYTELYFTDLYWPDFNEQGFEDALEDYASRQRRFGQTDEQRGM